LYKRAAVLLIAALSAGLLIAGCGDDDEASGDAPPISKAAFVKRANAVCEERISRVVDQITASLKDPAQASKDGGGKVAEDELVSAAVVPALQSEVEEIRALGAPEGDEAQVEAILEATEEVIANAEAEPEVLTESKEPYKAPEKLATEYGLIACPLNALAAGG